MDHKYENKVCFVAYVIIKSDFRLRCGRRPLFWAGWYTPKLLDLPIWPLLSPISSRRTTGTGSWLGPALFPANTLVLRIARFCAKRFGQC